MKDDVHWLFACVADVLNLLYRELVGISAQYRVRIPQSRKDTNRIIGMTSFSIGTNRTIGTDGPPELPCTQPGHMENNLSHLNEMHLQQ